jgi:phosphoenolpyruvate carboxykinase (GTP)
VTADSLAQLFAADPEAGLAEADDAARFFAGFGDRVPEAVHAQLAETRQRWEERLRDQRR